jgi:hypothetical protein
VPEPDSPERLSQTGHLIGWLVFGALVVVGFLFGVVTGYETPGPSQLAHATKSTGESNPLPVTSPTVTPHPTANPRASQKVETTVKAEPPKVAVKVDAEPAKVEQPKVAIPEPKKVLQPKNSALAFVSFQKDVLPIFRTYCLNCHGAGSGKPRGDVDLRTLATIIDPKNPPILTPGQPEKSAIYNSVADNAMPPEGKRPGKGETEVIRNWILGGAKPRRSKSVRRRGPS